ncbi:tautomerase family protein [Microbacterium sp. NEAU-LLC]|uniref:Tautomerase family protein n=1 Tax=Microbacterium helvum TaxID=2773713 RepID=A0ABR8NLX8_9MICO|nr:tautomerase family protein [Microbacterium helvum]MBD3941674.1 tautomerase family protein [Microbacterium helvum]
MPSVLIEVRRAYTPEQEVAIIDAVHAALVQAFKIPDEDRFSRLLSYPPHRMVDGPLPGEADGYTRVTIDCFPGRSLQAKQALYRGIVERLEPLGMPREKVSILLRESTFENWGLSGEAAEESGLGFTVAV